MTTHAIDADAKVITTKEMKSYFPSKAYKYTYKVKTNKKSYTYQRVYKNGYFYSTNHYALLYDIKNGHFSLETQNDIPIIHMKTPMSVGNKQTFYDVEDTLKYKVISTTKKLKIGKKSYKNVIVIKESYHQRFFYLAKNRGLILIKNKKNGKQEKLIKVSKL